MGLGDDLVSVCVPAPGGFAHALQRKRLWAFGFWLRALAERELTRCMTPKVSVSLITYNHAPFIAQCIESILAQRTTFPVELLIGEDDSSDGTREIVRRYAEAHPEQIRAFFHKPNRQNPPRRPVPGMLNSVNNLRSARGDYIAMLDGDDYWIDPLKLQAQADYLDAHPGCSTCFHRVVKIDAAGQPIEAQHAKPTLPDELSLQGFLQRKFAMPTASVMFRR